MAIVFDSDAGTISGLSVGGLPDGMVDGDMLAANAVTAGKIADGTIANADINSSAAIAGSKLVMPTGSVLQIQQGILTEQYSSTTGDTWLDVVTVNITPSSTSSKIYVSFNLNAMVVTDNQRAGARIARDSTGIGVATNVGLRTAASTTFAGISDPALRLKNMSNSVLDTPSTTSQITYRLQVQCENTTEIKVNHDDADGNGDSYFRGVSTITAMEIAG